MVPVRRNGAQPSGWATLSALVATEAQSASDSLCRSWRPFVAIQALAFALAIAYAFSPALRGALASVAEAKLRGGLPFAVLSTIVAALVLPEIAARVSRHPSALISWRVALLYVGFFGLIGAVVYEFYETLARLIGPGNDLATVVRKVLVDFTAFTLLISMPLSTTAMALRDADLRWRGVVNEWRTGAWMARYVRTLLPCWAFWIPAVSAVYAMPTDLQFPMFLLMQGAWALLLVALAPKEANA